MKQIKLFWNQMKGKKMRASIMIEVILILVVLIALVAIFKTQLTELVGEIFEKITKNGLGI